MFSEKTEFSGYFEQAVSWSDDMVCLLVRAKRQYQIAFLFSMGLCFLLAAGYLFLLPLSHTEFILIHQNDEGLVWAEPTQSPVLPPAKAQIESDIIRYITNRESYYSGTYEEQFSVTHILSSPGIAKEYEAAQSSKVKTAFINQFLKDGRRSVHIQSILFLSLSTPNKSVDQMRSNNLAEVNFEVEEQYHPDQKSQRHYFTALIGWEYRGTPDQRSLAWRNWNGFVVTQYVLTPRALSR